MHMCCVYSLCVLWTCLLHIIFKACILCIWHVLQWEYCVFYRYVCYMSFECIILSVLYVLYMLYESVVQITIIEWIIIVYVVYILGLMHACIQCVKYGVICILYVESIIHTWVHIVYVVHVECVLYCVWYIFCESASVCCMCFVCSELHEGNGHIWLFVWQTLVRWKRGYHFSIKDSGDIVLGGWLVSWDLFVFIF